MEMSKTNCHSRIIKRRLVWICQASPVNQPFIFLKLSFGAQLLSPRDFEKQCKLRSEGVIG